MYKFKTKEGNWQKTDPTKAWRSKTIYQNGHAENDERKINMLADITTKEVAKGKTISENFRPSCQLWNNSCQDLKYSQQLKSILN